MFKTWYFDGERSEMDNVIEIVKKYDFTKRFVSHEKVNSKGEVKPHFHILCEMESNKPWNAMTAHIIRTYKLKERNKEERKKRGQTGRGGYNCFGDAKKDVYTPEKYTRYIAKDGDIWGDIPADELKSIIEESKKKEDNRDWNDKLLNELESKDFKTRFNNYDKDGTYYCDKSVKLEIIKLYRKYGVVASRIKVENSFNYISQLSKKPFLRMTDEELLFYFYN